MLGSLVCVDKDGTKIVLKAVSGISFQLVEIIEDDFDGSRLLGLVFIAKYGEFQMLLCHLFCSFNYYYYFCKREARGALLYCI